MEHSNLKICWMHKDSEGKIATKGEQCTQNCNKNIDKTKYTDMDSQVMYESQLPDCHEGCTYYSRCRRVFEMGNFNNNCWNAPHDFKVNPADISVMRATQKIRTEIVDFVKSGSNIIMCSNYSGNGKTSRAISLSNTYISQICKLPEYDFDRVAHYAYIPKIVSDYALYEKSSYDNVRRQIFFQYIENLNYSDLAVWDGIGFDSKSYCENVIIRSIINTRINSALSNIFVINRSLEDFSEIVDDYDYKRILNSSIVFEFKGNDFRKQLNSSFVGGMQ